MRSGGMGEASGSLHVLGGRTSGPFALAPIDHFGAGFISRARDDKRQTMPPKMRDRPLAITMVFSRTVTATTSLAAYNC